MEAKVIKIISDSKIVLNVGSNSGVEVGRIFKVMEKQGEEVLDPDTGESYGTLDILKATVRVTNVYPKMCVCTNTESVTSIGLTLRELTKSLNVNLNQVSGGFDEHNISPIQIGDIAYSV